MAVLFDLWGWVPRIYPTIRCQWASAEFHILQNKRAQGPVDIIKGTIVPSTDVAVPTGHARLSQGKGIVGAGKQDRIGPLIILTGPLSKWL